MLLILALCLSALAGELKVHVLDVGQGDSILIEAPGGKTVLVDAGTSGAHVADKVRARGIDRLDLVIGTHPHADHIGGMSELLRSIPVGMYVDNGMTHTTMTYSRTVSTIEHKGVEYRVGIAGRVFNVGKEVRLRVIHPRSNRLRGTRSDLNSNSVVIRVEHGKNCILLTGDAEDPSERSMMNHELEPCGVLKVAHHGSAHSTSDAWLRAVQPKIAVISAGERNRYRHPAKETLDRLERADVEVHRTDIEGTVTLVSNGRKIAVEVERPVDSEAVADAGEDESESVVTPPPPPPPPEPTAPPAKEEKRKKFNLFKWLFGKKKK